MRQSADWTAVSHLEREVLGQDGLRVKGRHHLAVVLRRPGVRLDNETHSSADATVAERTILRPGSFVS